MNGVIYTRVSSDAQVDGTSLDDQERRCREYCQENDISIEKVFREEGESAKHADREVFLKAIEYCRKNQDNLDAFVVLKVDRFARNTEDHFTVRRRLAEFDIKLRSVTEKIGNDPADKFMETLLAASAEFDNDIRRERCKNGMEARLKEGLWPWSPPVGYEALGVSNRDEKLKEPHPPHPELFPLLQSALKRFATGKYSQTEIMDYLKEEGLDDILERKTDTRDQFISQILHDRLEYYAGYVKTPWADEGEKELYEGKHEAMITDVELKKIKQILYEDGNDKGKHKQHNESFPLRRTVRCEECGNYVTGSTSKGNGGKYHYYHCHTNKCDRYGKTMRKEDVEDEFKQILDEASLNPDFIEVVKETAKQHYEQKQQANRRKKKQYQKELTELKERRERIFEMREDGSYSKEEFKERKDEVEDEIMAVEISLSECKINEVDADMIYEEIKNFSDNLVAAWSDMSIEMKEQFQHLVLPDGITYSESDGVGTVKLGYLLRLNQEYGGKNYDLVDRRGFEPPTFSVQMRCSTN